MIWFTVLIAILGYAAWARYRERWFLSFSLALIEHAKKTPFFPLFNQDGSPYMERFWIVPFLKDDPTGGRKWYRSPVVWLLQQLDIGIRVHHIQSSDIFAMHDHPWPWASRVLLGGYWEVRPVFKDGIYQGERREWRKAGSWAFRRASSFHRIELEDVGGLATVEAWTLFITGPWQQRWGFMPEPAHNKVYYRDYLGLDSPRRVKEQS